MRRITTNCWPLVAIFSFLFTVCCVVVGVVESAEPCPPEKLQTCLDMAYKYLENDRFTFPTTKADVEEVCGSWSKFLDCIEGYVADCLDDREKNDFKQAVGSILDSVRNLCSDPDYQEQYFQHADCIKRTCTDNAYCGRYYKQMTRQVSQDFDTNDLCCNYRRFDSCVVTNTNAICGSTARDFASAMLNKSMSFLAARCQSGSGQSLDRCTDANEISVGPTFAVSNAPRSPAVVGPSSRALPAPTTMPTPKVSVTKGPESLAYENSSPGNAITQKSLILSFCLTFLTIIIKNFH